MTHEEALNEIVKMYEYRICKGGSWIAGRGTSDSYVEMYNGTLHKAVAIARDALGLPPMPLVIR